MSPVKETSPKFVQIIFAIVKPSRRLSSNGGINRFRKGLPPGETLDLIMPMRNPQFIYKIALAQVAAEAERSGTFAGMPVDAKDGYIHLSTAAQLPETLSLHFRGQGDLVLMAVRSHDLGETLRWEPSRGGQLFPHVYGSLPMSAVAWSAPIEVAADGACLLPEAVR